MVFERRSGQNTTSQCDVSLVSDSAEPVGTRGRCGHGGDDDPPSQEIAHVVAPGQLGDQNTVWTYRPVAQGSTRHPNPAVLGQERISCHDTPRRERSPRLCKKGTDGHLWFVGDDESTARRIPI